jgi:1-acyl-sn-glycerol-3-phosphate acyltransferase
MTQTLAPAKLTSSQKLARAILRLVGWRVEDKLPDSQKYVLLAAPHTSNWDFVFMLLFRAALGIKAHWAAKDTFFRGPWGALLKKIGGIPVNRRSRNNFVDQIVAAFRQCEEMILVIAPEGTRSMVGYWKSGFYYMAMGAGAPIAMGFLDYGRQVGGVGATLMPTGDIQADFAVIREFYTGIAGKHPRLQGEIKLREV